MLTIISKLTLLHDTFSRLLLLIPTFFVHNLSKYNTINKIFYNLSLDQVDGDCIEFGIFTGASLKHSIRSNKKYFKNSESIFYGLDSFEGFPDDDHPYFNKENFKNSYKNAKKIEKRFSNVKIIKGFFSDSINNSSEIKKINSLKFVFIDCDLYKSSIEPIKFIKDKIAQGGYIMIDDFTNIDKDGKTISHVFFDVFKNLNIVFTSNFGVSGVVYRYLGDSKIIDENS